MDINMRKCSVLNSYSIEPSAPIRPAGRFDPGENLLAIRPLPTSPDALTPVRQGEET